MKRRLWQRGAIGAVACALLPVAAGAQAETSSSAGTAADCGDVEYRCVIGGTTTLTLSQSWQRKLSAAGIRLHPIAPATLSGNRIVFPIAKTHGPQYGPAYVGVGPSAWSIDRNGCNIAKGGAVFHQGRLVIVKGSSSVAAVNALIDGSRLTLESVDPRGGRAPVALVFSFSGWKTRAVTAVGFRADAQLRLAPRSSRGLTVPSGVVGSLSLDVRVSPKIAVAVSCGVAAPVGQLPRVKGGPIYPLLAGSIAFGTPVKELYDRFGRPPGEGSIRWSKGPDTVASSLFLPVDGRTGPQQLLKAIRFDTSNVARSQLKGWQTPEGIHIGSSRADFASAYPGVKIGCNKAYRFCGASFDTPPRAIEANGRQVRQRLRVIFNFPLAGTPVNSIGVTLVGEEGTCWVNWRHEQKLMNFQATCFGPLVAARLEPVGSSPHFAKDLRRAAPSSPPSTTQASSGTSSPSTKWRRGTRRRIRSAGAWNASEGPYQTARREEARDTLRGRPELWRNGS